MFRPRHSARVHASLALLLGAFGSSACEKSGACGKSDLRVEISGNHGHDERIPKAELAKGPGRYRVTGGSHEHVFRLTEGDLEKLRAGQAVELRSASMNAHLHELRLSCAH